MREPTPFNIYNLLRSYMIKPKGIMIWLDIPGYEGRYQISNHGDVCSISNKILSENDTSVVLIGIDKSRHNISRNKLLKTYWKEGQYKGEERWKKLDHYGDYYVSNYANVKNCRRLILCPDEHGRVYLFTDGKKESVQVLTLFLKAFPPYEIEVNHEDKSVNWKKNENIVNTPQQRACG